MKLICRIFGHKMNPSTKMVGNTICLSVVCSRCNKVDWVESPDPTSDMPFPSWSEVYSAGYKEAQ